ncbi:MAG: sigma 54-interacting transcriptional regulator [Deltaproteobacteria bacterium]|nr:sigma 54-interacting transcriptional regulator [Deltaproteobacteria bacterium]
MNPTLKTRTASVESAFAVGDPTPGLLLAWSPPGATPTDRARVGEELTIGRSSRATWSLDDDLMSSVHLKVRPFGESLLVQDEGSRNGTWVDGERLAEPRTLSWGALVRAGQCLFVAHPDLQRLEAPASAPAEMAGPFFAPVLVRTLEIAARTEKHVLLVGESGTGKELCARWLARRISPDGPFVSHNCARFTSADEAEATLFGVGKAVFSGVGERAGLLEEAEGGVLLLDELHALPRRVQQSLLRFAEDGRHARIGGAQRALAVRIVFATNVPITAEPSDEAIASDLVARLFMVEVPSLAQRRADVPALFVSALDRAARAQGFDAATIRAVLKADHFEALCLADWTDRNVRALENLAAEVGSWCLERGMEPREAVRRVFGDRLGQSPVVLRADRGPGAGASHYEANREQIVTAYQAAGGNLTRAERDLKAAGLKVNRRWLAEFLRRWGVRA